MTRNCSLPLVCAYIRRLHLQTSVGHKNNNKMNRKRYGALAPRPILMNFYWTAFRSILWDIRKRGIDDDERWWRRMLINIHFKSAEEKTSSHTALSITIKLIRCLGVCNHDEYESLGNTTMHFVYIWGFYGCLCEDVEKVLVIDYIDLASDDSASSKIFSGFFYVRRLFECSLFKHFNLIEC